MVVLAHVVVHLDAVIGNTRAEPHQTMCIVVAVAVSPNRARAVQVGIVERAIVVGRAVAETLVILEECSTHVTRENRIAAMLHRRGAEAGVMLDHTPLGHADNHRILRDVVNHIVTNHDIREHALLPLRITRVVGRLEDLVVEHYTLILDVVDVATLDTKVVVAGRLRLVVGHQKLDTGRALLLATLTNDTLDVVNLHVKDVDALQQACIGTLHLHATTVARLVSPVRELEVRDNPVGLVLERDDTTTDKALSGNQRTCPLAIGRDYNRTTLHARALRTHGIVSGPHRATTEEDRIARSKGRSRHLFERTPRLGRRGTRIAILTRLRVDIVIGSHCCPTHQGEEQGHTKFLHGFSAIIER